MNLKVRAWPHATTVVDITPESAGWKYVGFKVVHLEDQESFVFLEPGRECCLTILSGTVDAQVGERHYAALGSRACVFDPVAPCALYIPPGQAVTLTARNTVELALSTAPATGKYPFRVISPDSIRRTVRGRGTNTRHVCDILPESALAESLLVVEVITPASHSSSYPPHKHDTASQTETELEETYFHRLNPPQGYAFQRVYTDDRSLDETVLLEDRDTVLVPRGYHPCTVPHGYTLYYLNTMAGPERKWAFTNDPAHDWIARQATT